MLSFNAFRTITLSFLKPNFREQQKFSSPKILPLRLLQVLLHPTRGVGNKESKQSPAQFSYLTIVSTFEARSPFYYQVN